jgi:hypothetical protein
VLIGDRRIKQKRVGELLYLDVAIMIPMMACPLLLRQIIIPCGQEAILGVEFVNEPLPKAGNKKDGVR